MAHVQAERTSDRDSDAQDTPLRSGARAADGLQVAPLALVLTIGALPVPTVLVGLVALKSIWLTLAGMYYVWVVSPTVVCYAYAGTRMRSLAAYRRVARGARRQLAIAVPACAAVVGVGVLAYHFLGRVLGVDPRAIARGLEPYGLVEAAVAADVSVIAWLVVLNPVMEEFFWRLFLFAQLRGDDDEGGARWWGPACGVAALYAAYHVPVIAAVGLPPPLVALGGACLVGFGLAMQLVVERHGLVVAIGVHAAADITACVVLADVVWRLGLEARR